MLNRAEIVDRNFTAFCHGELRQYATGWRRSLDELVADGTDLTGQVLRELFESQLVSRHLDLAARELRKRDQGYYTIGSSGHEGNVVLGRLLRRTDPVFLHYRSGALMAERARQHAGTDFVRDTLLSLMAAAADPIAQGRHKVWGSVPLWVPPQTSTIASQLPKAVGAAVTFSRATRVRCRPACVDQTMLPPDSIFMCSFGDATVNHSVAVGAFNALAYWRHRKLRAPLLLVCEDNGLGISVRSPEGWVTAHLQRWAGIKYYQADGRNLLDAYQVASNAIDYVRSFRAPAVLHFTVVRLKGHAGSDVETTYRTLEEMAATEAQDPLLVSARILVEYGFMSPDDVLALYEQVRQRVMGPAGELGGSPQLASAAEIIAPLAPLRADQVALEATRAPARAERIAAFGDEAALPEKQGPKHLAVNINRALVDLLAKYPEALIFGEDVGRKGGVYHLTADLQKMFGSNRVFDTLLDETSILGMALGAAHLGLLPIPEIQYLAYLHNAIDQLRSEACSTQFFSAGQFQNPMVVRIAALAYQRGFGGHFHNDNSIAALRDIPGLIVAVPARGDDAAGMLRTCAALARVDGRVVTFLEPIALYMAKDLYETGDGQWQFAYPSPDWAVPFGEPRVYHAEATDLTVFTFGNGVPMTLRAVRTLERESGARVRVVDLRWLNPLNEPALLAHARATGRVLVVDEGRRTGGVSEAILTLLTEQLGGRVKAGRVTGQDTYIPLGPAANLVLPQEADVVAAARRLLA